MIQVAIFDYGAGNLHSLAKAIEGETRRVRLETDPVRATEADVLVLPGVGAFTNAAQRLASGRAAMRDAIRAGLPTLGVCLGMQLLFEESEEGGGGGLGVIPGRVRRLRAARVPQIGWNAVEPVSDDAAALGLPSLAYFANSYVCEPADPEAALAYTTHDGDRFVSAVAVANAVGVQFHPEKSSAAGVWFVRDYIDRVGPRGATR